MGTSESDPHDTPEGCILQQFFNEPTYCHMIRHWNLCWAISQTCILEEGRCGISWSNLAMIVTSYRTYTVFGRFCYDFCVTLLVTWEQRALLQSCSVVIISCVYWQSQLRPFDTHSTVRMALYYVAVCSGMQVSKYGSKYSSHKSFIF